MSPFLFGEFVRLRYCVIFITLPCIFLGMIYPYLFRSRWFPKEQPDRTVAWMSAINAIGSISGAFLTIFVFIPLFGSQVSFKCLAVLFSLVACICFIYELMQIKSGITSKAIRTVFQFGVLAICFFIAVSSQWDLKELTSGKNVYFTKMHVTDQSEMLFLQEGVVDGFVTVVRRNGINTLLTNGKFQGNDNAEAPAQISIALLPILHLKKIEKAAVIGLGTGQSAAVIKAAGFPSVDILELSPAVVNAATTCFSRSNRSVASAKGVNLHVADGRTYLQLSEDFYDLISIEVSSIWFAGATNIYSREFYEIAKARLTQDGVLQQWIQFHHIGLNEILSTIATAKDVFPYVSVWFAGGQGILLASKKPLVLNLKLKEQIKNREEMRFFFNVLQRWNINLHNLLRCKLLEMSDVDRLVQEARERRIPINTDKNRYLEFHTPRYNLERIDHRRIILQKLLAYQA
ncbi:MAG: fused MFS/spermidine synthase [Desulfobacterales bacterium]|nr:fused MFS/spermidine synthase [Desulfobacterales bacterium]